MYLDCSYVKFAFVSEGITSSNAVYLQNATEIKVALEFC